MITLENAQDLSKVLKAVEDGNEKLIPYMPLEVYETFINDLDGEIEDDIKTNGWQVDFWLYFKVSGRRYLLSGSWYYGKYKISKA